MARQRPRRDGMDRQYWQDIVGFSPRDVFELFQGKHEPSGYLLDRDFPDAGTADENLIFGRRDGFQDIRVDSM